LVFSWRSENLHNTTFFVFQCNSLHSEIRLED
jgi:hypothetical protein